METPKTTNKLSDTVSRKFLKTLDLSEWEIDTEDGWKDLKSVSKTIQYEIWYLEISNGTSLRCADTHIVFRKDMKEVFVKDLKVGDEILTRDGLQKVTIVYNQRRWDNMYDVSIDSETNSYYSNDILSHNSLTVSIYLLWLALYTDTTANIFVLAHKGDMSKQLLMDLKVIYEELPKHLKKGVKKYDATGIEFEDGSKIRSGTTTPDTIRGQSITFLLLDEFAFVPPHIVDEFYTAANPTLSTGGTMCIISTPNGANGLFYELYKGAKSNTNGFVVAEVDWREVPRPNGQDPDEWAQETIKEIGKVRFSQEHLCDFLGSSSTLISGEHLEKIMDTLLDPIEYEEGKLRVWFKPKPKHIYVIGVDVAKGVGKDYSVIQVVDITKKNKYKLVANYRDNFIRPDQFTGKINEIGRMYNDAYAIVENNTFGSQICIDLWEEYEYENLFREYGKREHGVNANVRTKATSTSNLKTIMEEGYLKIYDEKTYKELTGFEEIKPNIYGCTGKSHDDLVMSLVWISYFINNPYWKDLEVYERKSLGTIEDIDETSDIIGISEHATSTILDTQEEFEPFDFQSERDDDDFDW
jgi:hypothetical protein